MAEKTEQKEIGVRYPDLVLFGPPGCGKGTQGCKLSEKFGYKSFSMGEMLRAEVAKGTPEGLAAEPYMKAGGLVPDEIVAPIFEEYLKNLSEGELIIFDGFPRNEAQRRLFDTAMEKAGRKHKRIALVAKTPEEEALLVQRLFERGQEGSGRSDDQSIETIRDRMKTYAIQTKEVLDGWKREGKRIYERSTIGEIEEISGWVETIVQETSEKVREILDQ